MNQQRYYPAVLAVILGVLPVLFASADESRPNILFIMSDDHCSQAVGAYGGPLAELNPTPTIDTLARDGMLFSNCFVTNSICTPSRACIMTGQYNHINGVRTLGGNLDPEHQFLAIEMNNAGYQTAMIGKWHLKREPAAFDYYQVLPGQGSYFGPVFRLRGDQSWPDNTVRYSGHSTDIITDIALEWLADGREEDQPFFMMLHYKAPHDMFEHARRYNDYLASTEIPEPESLWNQPNFGSIATRGHNDELLPYIGSSIGRRNIRRNYVRLWARDVTDDEEAKRQAYNEYLRRYLRCVKGIDDNLARVFAYLEEHDLVENTIVIYTGDQGFMLGEHDYMDKRWMYDESQRMPFLVRYPKGIAAGSRSDAIIENIDFPAMMLDFAGVETPEYMQGASFRTICETGEEPDDWRDAAYYRYWMHMAHNHDNPAHFGIRTKEHKLIFYYGCGMQGQDQSPPGWELYDLVEDSHEVNNVYDDPAYAEIMEQLKSQLAEMREQNGDSDEDYPAIQSIVEEFWDYDEKDRQRAIEISHAYLESRTRGR